MITPSVPIREYITERGRNPYREWLDGLPIVVAARIQARIFRISEGNRGDYRSVGHGVQELRIFAGPGYRDYFGVTAETIVILLVGGNKGTQRRDIIKAREYWIDYLRRG